MTTQRKILIIFFLLFLIAIPGVIFYQRENLVKKQPPAERIADPTSYYYNPYSEEYKKENAKIQQEEKPIHNREEAVSRFIDTLPYKGTLFTATYDINTNYVTVTLQKGYEAEAHKEFDAYLKKNGIENKSWLKWLTIN